MLTCGVPARYKDVPVFESGALGVPAVVYGDVNGGYETYAFEKKAAKSSGKGGATVIFYLKGDRVVGVTTIGCSASARKIATEWVKVGQPPGVAEAIEEAVKNQGKRTHPIQMLLAKDAPRMIFGEDASATETKGYTKLVCNWQPSMGKEAYERRDPVNESDGEPDTSKGNYKTRVDYYTDAIMSGIRSINNKDRDQSRELTKKEKYDHMAFKPVGKSDTINSTDAGHSGLNTLR